MPALRLRKILYALTAIGLLGVILWSLTRPADRWAFVEDFAKRHGLAGGVIAYGLGGEGKPELFAFGMADAENGRRTVISDRFRIASLTKPVTAETILAMSDLGLLALDRPLAAYFPEVLAAPDPRLAEITLRHLLQHRAGWDASETFEPLVMTRSQFRSATGWTGRIGPNCAGMAEGMLSLPLQFAPGERFAYSNLGFCWLERVISKSTYGSFRKAVEALVPSLPRFSLDKGDLTGGPSPDATGQAELLENDPEVTGGSGGIITDAASYYAFASAYKDPRLYARPAGEVGPVFYGLGWRVRHLPEGVFLTHMGSMPGAFAIVVRDIEGPTFVALFNGRAAQPFEAFDQLLQDLLSQGFPDR